ncbi:MAG: P-II family nitrogen regulator [Flavobacteriales bacterium]|nr:P-II family nitrogen regulator [Flavobacteriales bacterium]
MKKLQAIIRASKFEAVKEALHKHEIDFFSYYEIKGCGHEKSDSLSYRGAVYDVGYIARIKIEILVTEGFVETAIEAITTAAKTGEKGDGLVYVTDLQDVTNIRTGLKNNEAINK